MKTIDPQGPFNIILVDSLFESETTKLILGTPDGRIRIWNNEKVCSTKIYIIIKSIFSSLCFCLEFPKCFVSLCSMIALLCNI